MAPEQLSAGSVHGLDHTPCAREVENAVDGERRRFEPALGFEIECPGEAKIVDGLRIDLSEGAIAFLGIGASVGEPISGFRIGSNDSLTVDAGSA